MNAIALANTAGTIDVVGILNNLVNWAFSFLLIFAVICILYSAFLFLTAAGDTEKISKAKSQLMWSVIAVGVAVVSKAIVYAIRSLFGAPNPPPGFS